MSGLTADALAERLRGTSLPADPARVSLPSHRPWPASWHKTSAGALLIAGVLVPVIARPSGLTLLLTRRSTNLTHHAGQVSFPGGREEPGDADIVATALRETEEEVGVERTAVSIVGVLPTMPTITGYAVTPVVGLLPAATRLSLEAAEVDLAFEVPLDFLLDESNERRSERLIEGVSVPLREFRYGGQRIWGATASMIADLRKLVSD